MATPGRLAPRSSARSRSSRISPKRATISARCSRKPGSSTRRSNGLEQALASTPEYPDALNNLGYALLLTGRDAEARTLYEKALALQPDFPEALNNLGLLLGRSGNLEQAERYFRDALARKPDYGEAANNLALVLVNRGQSDAAVSLLEGLVEKAPQFESTYITLAKIHLSANRTREGIADPRTAAATKPEASCRARASPELETVSGAPRPTRTTKSGRHREVGAGRDERWLATQNVKRVTS